MNDLDYAEMIEIPMSTLNVVKKKSSKRKPSLMARVVEKVNNDYELKEEKNKDKSEGKKEETVKSEDVFDVDFKGGKGKRDKLSIVYIAEFACAIALLATIFLTNVFMYDSAINTFIRTYISNDGQSVKTQEEKNYSEITLTSIVNSSDVSLTVSANGVMSLNANASIYPVADGKVTAVTKEDETYTVTVSHTSLFVSVISGLKDVYVEKGNEVYSNIPVGLSMQENTVRVSLYNDGSLLSCYSLNDSMTPVWNV